MMNQQLLTCWTNFALEKNSEAKERSTAKTALAPAIFRCWNNTEVNIEWIKNENFC